jgi:hypothetical protein
MRNGKAGNGSKGGDRNEKKIAGMPWVQNTSVGAA